MMKCVCYYLIKFRFGMHFFKTLMADGIITSDFRIITAMAEAHRL